MTRPKPRPDLTDADWAAICRAADAAVAAAPPLDDDQVAALRVLLKPTDPTHAVRRTRRAA